MKKAVFVTLFSFAFLHTSIAQITTLPDTGYVNSLPKVEFGITTSVFPTDKQFNGIQTMGIGFILALNIRKNLSLATGYNYTGGTYSQLYLSPRLNINFQDLRIYASPSLSHFDLFLKDEYNNASSSLIGLGIGAGAAIDMKYVTFFFEAHTYGELHNAVFGLNFNFN